MKGAAVFVLALLLAGCSPGGLTAPPPAPVATSTSGPVESSAPAQGQSDLELTWTQAVVVLPVANGEVVVRRMSELEVGLGAPTRPMPTIVYLHGCTGLGDLSILKVLAQAGFAVVAPDSMARRYRPLQCDPATGRGGYNLFVYDFRLAEISYALQALSRLSWVDQANLFLVGGSEGGVAAALYRGDAFRARVIAAWTCHGAPVVAGLEAPASEPVLAIVSAGDPWYRNGKAYGQEGDCGAYMAERPLARSVVLPASRGHGVLSDPEVQAMVAQFLLGNLRR